MIIGKRGYFFILDATIGIIVLVVSLITIFSTPVISPTKSRIDVISNDVLSHLSNNKIEDINSKVAGVGGDLWNLGFITNEKNTLIQQIGEFYFKEDTVTAEQFINEVVKDIVPLQFNLEIAIIDNGVETVLSPSVQTSSFIESKEKSRITVIKKGVVFGMNKEDYTLWGPYVLEVRMWE